MVAVAWAMLGYGLLFSEHDLQAWDDLEAGGRFAANLAVYLPYLGLTPAIAAVVILGLLRPSTPLSVLVATAVVVIALFAWWVAVQDYLFPAQPQLSASLFRCLIADAGAAGALAGAWVMAGAREADASPR